MSTFENLFVMNKPGWSNDTVLSDPARYSLSITLICFRFPLSTRNIYIIQNAPASRSEILVDRFMINTP